jgi:hypothetical protein
MSKARWLGLGVGVLALALAAGPATAAFAGQTPTPTPTPTQPTVPDHHKQLKQQEFDILISNTLPAGSSVLGTGPINIASGGIDKSTNNSRVDILETDSTGANSVTINHEPLGGATIDRVTCSINLAQVDLPWSIHTGTGRFLGAIGNGFYDLVGQFSFPTQRNVCTLPTGLTPGQAAWDLNNGVGLPEPLQFDISVQAVGRAVVSPLPSPNPCPTVWNSSGPQPSWTPTCNPSLDSVTLPLPNTLTLTFNGSPFAYNVHINLRFVAPGLLLVGGTLTDNFEPVSLKLPIHGVLFGNKVVFSVSYPTTGPDAGSQGVRTFSGVVGPFGHVTGLWSETGTEAGSGAFQLTRI